MIKRFLRNYGITILIYVVGISLFAVGFIFGRFGKSAPDIQTAERKKNIESNVEYVKGDTNGDGKITILDLAYIQKQLLEKPFVPAEQQKTREMTVTATAYCPCEKCCGKTDGVTATGIKATAGRTIAVDPSFIPYGTEVIINGNTYIAEDCGGAVKGNKIDIFFDTHDEAVEFGKQNLTIFIKE